MHAKLAWAAVCCWVCACIPPQLPAQQVSDVARELNVAARFGRMDVAIGYTAPAHQSEFLKRHSNWGREIRVVDVELAQLDVDGAETADVLVDVSWVRMDEGILRSTRIEQRWENPGGGWKLSGEKRVEGDLGLLGEPVVVLRPDRPRDVHLPVKTIR